jgi:hypothetical protein
VTLLGRTYAETGVAVMAPILVPFASTVDLCCTGDRSVQSSLDRLCKEDLPWGEGAWPHHRTHSIECALALRLLTAHQRMDALEWQIWSRDDAERRRRGGVLNADDGGPYVGGLLRMSLADAVNANWPEPRQGGGLFECERTMSRDALARTSFLWRLYAFTHLDLAVHLWTATNRSDAALCTRPSARWPSDYERLYPWSHRHFSCWKLPNLGGALQTVPWFRKIGDTRNLIAHVFYKANLSAGLKREFGKILRKSCEINQGFAVIQSMLAQCSLFGLYPHSRSFPTVRKAILLRAIFQDARRRFFEAGASRNPPTDGALLKDARRPFLRGYLQDPRWRSLERDTNRRSDVDAIVWFVWKEALVWFVSLSPAVDRVLRRHYHWQTMVTSTLRGMEYVRRNLVGTPMAGASLSSVDSHLMSIYHSQQMPYAHRTMKDSMVAKLIRSLKAAFRRLGITTAPVEDFGRFDGPPDDEMRLGEIERAGLDRSFASAYRTLLSKYEGRSKKDHPARREVNEIVHNMPEADLRLLSSAVENHCDRKAALCYPLSARTGARQEAATRAEFAIAPDEPLNPLLMREYYCPSCLGIAAEIVPAVGSTAPASGTRRIGRRCTCKKGMMNTRYSFSERLMYCRRSGKKRSFTGARCSETVLLPMAMSGMVWSINRVLVCRCERCTAMTRFGSSSFLGDAILCEAHAPRPEAPPSRQTEPCLFCGRIVRRIATVVIVDDRAGYPNRIMPRCWVCPRHWPRGWSPGSRWAYLMSDLLRDHRERNAWKAMARGGTLIGKRNRTSRELAPSTNLEPRSKRRRSDTR